MLCNVSKADQIKNVLLTVGYGKTVLFLIAILFFLAFLAFKGIKNDDNVRIRYPYMAIFLTMCALFLIVTNYASHQTPAQSFESEIIMGNDSDSLSINDQSRLSYLGEKFMVVKRSNQDTPSVWDIDNLNLEDNRDFWKTNEVQAIWDTSIQKYDGWTIIHCELYFPRNGIDPLGSKHEHDYEFVEFYFYMNETTPRYVVFPTYTKITEHPRELLTWEAMPRVGVSYALRLDPQTNAFHQEYWRIPEPSKNMRPILISPEPNELFQYLSEIERWQVLISTGLFVITFAYCFSVGNWKNRHLLLMFIFLLVAAYPLLTLQYDYVGNPSFRVWQNGEHYDDSYWYYSQSGRAYIDGYGGLPHERDRWTKPEYSDELGIQV